MQTDRGRETHRHTGTDIHTHGDTHSWTDTEGDTYAETHCGPETPPVFSDSKNTFLDHWIKKLEFAVGVDWQTFYVKGQMVSILGLQATVATIQFSP